MELQVVGAGVGRTGTHSLKIALERLLGAPCHHMLEILGDPAQIPAWTAAANGNPDWPSIFERYAAVVDWPGAAFWKELHVAYPDALVLLSVRDPAGWYRSASNTIFQTFDLLPPEFEPWMNTVRRLLEERFSADLESPDGMIEAFERHNEAVKATVPSDRLLVWELGDGWAPICERLGLPVPDEPFPLTNTTAEFRANFGMAPLA
jgi:hypothetical protein